MSKTLENPDEQDEYMALLKDWEEKKLAENEKKWAGKKKGKAATSASLNAGRLGSLQQFCFFPK